MATTGTKRNSLKQQRINAELGLIVDEFGRAMQSANRQWIGDAEMQTSDDVPRFTMSMKMAWYRYVYFCKRNPS